MNSRAVESKTYGNFGQFPKVENRWHKSPSGRIHLLGEERIGGKTEGLLFLDRSTVQVPGYQLPERTLVVCNDFFGIGRRPVDNPLPVEGLGAEKLAELFDVMEKMKFSPVVAVRSSALIEDQLGWPGAGKFHTDFFGKALTSPEAKSAFIQKLLGVINSSYTGEGLAHWKSCGFSEIPPMEVIIQEVVGNSWQYAPRYFFPAVAGIVNTAYRKSVRISVVVGLGVSAVSSEGLGLLYKLPILEGGKRVYHNMNHSTGKLNLDDVSCIDLSSDNMIRLRGPEADKLSVKELLKGQDWFFPPIDPGEMALALERQCGQALDIEWASRDGRELTMVQARPINKRAIIARPEIATEKIILETDQVDGVGEREFSHAILFDHPFGSPNRNLIKNLLAKYPNSFVVYGTNIARSITQEQIFERILPFTDVLVIKDLESYHMHGTGLQHIFLELVETGKIILFTRKGMFDGFNNHGKIVETVMDPIGLPDGDFKVFQFNSPVKVAVDDEHDMGMVYTA
ncbi:hypothetical protein HZC35_07640 [Candidatus Saganbacteria bacterium]|nr:hypothetical protein [Candidatus Saganbacteria bacterium]